MLAIGVLAWRRTADLADYFLGGRRLPAWISALSAQASDMSGWLLLGLPGYAYAAGLEAGWIALGLFLGTWANWHFVAARLREATAAVGAITLPEYLERRFADPTPLLRTLSAGFILLFFLFYTSSGLVAGGKLFNTVFGLPYEWAVAAGLFAILLYTLFGGFLAVSWTDALQALMMLGALAAAAVFAVQAVGGWQATQQALQAANPNLLDAMTGSDGTPLGAVGILSLLAWGLGYFGQPHILARFMAIRSARDVPLARKLALGWVAVVLVCAIAAGLAGAAGMTPGLEGADAERVFIVLVGLLFHPVVAGICLAAVLAAIMSTADSQLLVASSALTEDLLRRHLGERANRRQLLWAGRAAVVAISVAAFALALDPDSKVLELVAWAWAGFGAAFGPVIILSLYWPRMTRAGAVAGILTGGVTVIAWKQIATGAFAVYELLPGFVLAALAVIVTSIGTGRGNQRTERTATAGGA